MRRSYISFHNTFRSKSLIRFRQNFERYKRVDKDNYKKKKRKIDNGFQKKKEIPHFNSGMKGEDFLEMLDKFEQVLDYKEIFIIRKLRWWHEVDGSLITKRYFIIRKLCWWHKVELWPCRTTACWIQNKQMRH